MKNIKIIAVLAFGLFISFQLKEKRFNNGLGINPTPFKSYHLKLGCNTIQHETGSTIIIPEGTFDCEDKIILKYREFRDPYDMIIHNIPMHYNKNNKRYQLESGGMFEIKAECNGVPIEPVQGKQIQIRYRCDKHIDGLETYKMNEEGRYWQRKLIKIMEMSFNKDKNSSTRPDLWGNEAIPKDTQRSIDQETGEPLTDEDGESLFFTRKHPYLEGIFKGINISEMGLYNYDAIIDELGVIPVIGSTVILNQADLNIESLFVIYDSLNTSYYYSPEDLKKRFVIRPNVKAHIFGILKNGFIATFSMARFNAVNWGDFRNKNFSFMLDLDPVKPIKKKDLKK
jgi:hypothetical protein